MAATPLTLRRRRPASRVSAIANNGRRTLGALAVKISPPPTESITYGEWLTRQGKPPAPGAVLPTAMVTVKFGTAERVQTALPLQPACVKMSKRFSRAEGAAVTAALRARAKTPEFKATNVRKAEAAPWFQKNAPAAYAAIMRVGGNHGYLWGGRVDDMGCQIAPLALPKKMTATEAAEQYQGYEDLVNGPGDAEQRFLRFAKLNPRVKAELDRVYSPVTPGTRQMESAMEKRDARREYQAMRAQILAKYAGPIKDTYWKMREIMVARYHKKRKKKVKIVKTIIGGAAIGLAASAFIGPAAAGASKAAAGASAAQAGGAAGAGAVAGGSSAATAAATATKAAAVVAGAGALSPGAIAAAGEVATEAGITSTIKNALPKVVDTVNSARTIKAIADGEVPPPPISLDGENFKDWAVSIGSALLQEKLQKKQLELDAAEQAAVQRQLEAEIVRQQRLAADILPRGAPMYPAPMLAPQVVAAQTETRGTDDWVKIGGAALLTALLTGAI